MFNFTEFGMHYKELKIRVSYGFLLCKSEIVINLVQQSTKEKLLTFIYTYFSTVYKVNTNNFFQNLF